MGAGLPPGRVHLPESGAIYAITKRKCHAQIVAAANAAVGSATNYEEGLADVCKAIAAKHSAGATVEILTVPIALVQRMNPTNKQLTHTKNSNKEKGRSVRGWFDPENDFDMALVPGGKDAVKK